MRRALVALLTLAALGGGAVVAVQAGHAGQVVAAFSTDDGAPESIDRPAPILRAQTARPALSRAGAAVLAAVAAFMLVTLAAGRVSLRATLLRPMTAALPVASRAPPLRSSTP